MAGKDYYKVLGVSEGASVDQIKSSYRKLAKKFHPDMNPGSKDAEAKFKEISEAYYVLGDEKRKQEYDMMRKGGYTYARGGQGSDPAAGFDFDDLLSHLGFAGGRSAGRGRGGMDYDIFDDAFSQFFASGGRGGSRVYSVNLDRDEVRTDIESAVDIPAALAKNGGRLEVKMGDGQNISVKVPPNTASGTRLRLKGFGEECPHCHKKGDLFIKVRVK